MMMVGLLRRFTGCIPEKTTGDPQNLVAADRNVAAPVQQVVASWLSSPFVKTYLLWVLKKEHRKCSCTSPKFFGESAAKRKEKLVSEGVIFTQWAWDELQAHLSG
jgi:hypothetical protein